MSPPFVPHADPLHSELRDLSAKFDRHEVAELARFDKQDRVLEQIRKCIIGDFDDTTKSHSGRIKALEEANVARDKDEKRREWWTRTAIAAAIVSVFKMLTDLIHLVK